MPDGKIANTNKVEQSWEEKETEGSSANVRLHKSFKGQYFLENWRGSMSYVTSEEAATWILLNEGLVPDDLTDIALRLEV